MRGSPRTPGACVSVTDSVRRWLAFALLFAAFVGSSSLRVARPDETPVLQEATPAAVPELDESAAPRTIEELRARIHEVLVRERVPGVGIALVDRNGPIWTGGVGVRAIGGAPVDADTAFRVASITKSFVGLGVMRLVERGALDLDRPIAEIMPDVVIDNPWHDVAPVTLAHVLEHTAGFDDMRFNETFTTEDAMTAADALAINPRSRTVRWRPGSRFSYSNVGYTVAARAIEVATGEPFDVWIRREVLQPLGMRDADFRRTTTLADRLAVGHRGRRALEFRPIAHRPAGALLASPRDLAGLVHFWLRRGDGFAPIVSERGLARIEHNGTLPYGPRDVGYGLGNYGDVGHRAPARGHDGGLPGFSSNLRYFPDLGVGYVVLLDSNSGNAMTAIRRLVFAYLVRDRELPALPPVPEGPPTVIDVDAFAFANPRHELFGFVDRVLRGWHLEGTTDGLRMEGSSGGSVELVRTADGGFRRRHESGTTVRLERDADGEHVLVAHGVYGEATSWWLVRLRAIVLVVAIVLLALAPLFALGVLGAAAVRRRAVPALGLVVWPALASVAFDLIGHCLGQAGARHVLGVVHPWTIAVCVATVAFALASGASMVAALRWTMRADRPRLRLRLLPSLAATAAFGLALWVGAHGIIGLRTWAW
jgi:CubicO group peptidase (beta-lactamase class C family)